MFILDTLKLKCKNVWNNIYETTSRPISIILCLNAKHWKNLIILICFIDKEKSMKGEVKAFKSIDQIWHDLVIRFRDFVAEIH